MINKCPECEMLTDDVITLHKSNCSKIIKPEPSKTEEQLNQVIALLKGFSRPALQGPANLKQKVSSLQEVEESIWQLRNAFENEIKSIEISKSQYERLESYLHHLRKRDGLPACFSVYGHPTHMEWFGIRIKEAE